MNLRAWNCLAFVFSFATTLVGQGTIDDGQLAVERHWDRVVIVDLGDDRPVDGALHDDIRREVERLDRGEEVAIVLRIDSPGGSVDDSQAIANFIASYRESPTIRIFAWVPRFAVSGGAWIAFSCRGLLISPAATIGNVQPIYFGSNGPELSQGKIVSTLAQQLIIAGRTNGLAEPYPELFLEAMVDRDLEIVEATNRRNPREPKRYFAKRDWFGLSAEETSAYDIRFITKEDKALTLRGEQLPPFGFRVKLVDDEHDVVAFVASGQAKVERRQVGGRGPLGLNLDWSLLLVIGGIFCLILELKTPGLGVFGLLGVALIVAWFFVQAGWTESAILPIALFLLGAVLVLIEVMILPGHIIPGLLGLALILYSTWLGIARPDAGFAAPLPDWQDANDRSALLTWATTFVTAVGGGSLFSLVFGRLLHRLPFLNRLVLLPSLVQKPPAARSTTRAADGDAIGVPIGARGVAHTPLRPAGVVVIDGHKVDVVTEGSFIAAGTTVSVTAVAGSRVVVRAAVDDEGAEA